MTEEIGKFDVVLMFIEQYCLFQKPCLLDAFPTPSRKGQASQRFRLAYIQHDEEYDDASSEPLVERMANNYDFYNISIFVGMHPCLIWLLSATKVDE